MTGKNARKKDNANYGRFLGIQRMLFARLTILYAIGKISFSIKIQNVEMGPMEKDVNIDVPVSMVSATR